MFITHISTYIFYVLLSSFLKSTAFLIIAALIHLCFKNLSSNFKYVLWLTILLSIILIPVCFFIISPDFFRIEVQSGSSSEALRILDAMLPRYNEFGSRIQSASGIDSVKNTTLSVGLVSRWAVICVGFWIAGIIFSLTRVILGKIGIMKISTDACVIENRSIIETLEFLNKRLGIQRNIQVLTSSSYRVPFTYGTFKPVILLPPGATLWPGERLRSVLIHELAHIKRIDSFTRFFARIVCSLFWFIPAVWIAYRQLCTEQEKSCDEYAVGEGIEAVRYARHILNVVQFVKVRALLTGIFISRGKKKMLEKRILHLLRPGALKFLSRKKMLVAIASLCFLLLFPILVFNPMFADDVRDDVIKKISERDFWNTVSGTWVNTEYPGFWRFEQMVIVYLDGKCEYYPMTKDTNPSRHGYYHAFTEAWIDSKGVIWYNFIDKSCAGELCALGMISESGNRWEYIACPDVYPTDWDTSQTRYPVYRQYNRRKN